MIYQKLDPADKVLFSLTCKQFHTWLREQSQQIEQQVIYEHESPIKRGTIPSTVTSLTFNDSFHIAIPPGKLPSSITSLKFGAKYNRMFKKEVLPDNLIELTFGNSFNRHIDDDSFPTSLRTLSFGQGGQFMNSFNMKLTKRTLPRELTSLTLGAAYRHPMEAGVLPPALCYFDFSFNAVLNHQVLPSSLRTLKYMRQLPENFVYPRSLTELSVYRQPTTAPARIKLLSFISASIPAPVALPPTLTYLSVENMVIAPRSLPQELQVLEFGPVFNQVIEEHILPVSITTLRFGAKYNQHINPAHLPSALTSLSFDNCNFQLHTPNSLPNSLRRLKICSSPSDQEYTSTGKPFREAKLTSLTVDLTGEEKFHEFVTLNLPRLVLAFPTITTFILTHSTLDKECILRMTAEGGVVVATHQYDHSVPSAFRFLTRDQLLEAPDHNDNEAT
ncbi:hypothetical protein SAMD00019534_051910 [Acytostelium subglobosum LB1]|uniref:hypothetical protein n=1 Tax=Acytostelium subglobosum LB1 TaxID=1410327 RepID=UPI0006449A64|nr:hypothetical protein SAMD00019534_051910 [Acytostelium subglobosum LB1]GAM22016.1 hypothetical protein SAMD00019534_051910 [Acytostelium subglobosum LB1]|eukprot:XP_012755116.1 hypothetical protein SAMD00019534_051910 [Acytostelium subglobosum LB1]